MNAALAGIAAQCRSDLAALARFARRALRTGKALAGRGSAFPMWLRILYILGVQAWCPLPIDEAFLLAAIVATVSVPAYRRAFRAAWEQAA